MKKFITNQEMSAYLNLAFNSEIFRKIIGNCKNYDNVFGKLGNVLAKYYISTMDNSMEGIELVCNLFINEYLNNTFDKKFMNLLIDRCAESANLSGEITIVDKIKIVEIIRNRNLQNMFYTHCFPGALYETVASNGLDISNELFKAELSLLERYFRTAYKVGKLCYCEFSEASLSYAISNVPERVGLALGGVTNNNGKNKHESYLNSFRNKLLLLLREGEINQKRFEELFEAGKRIIDFYCSNQQSCIAVFRNNSFQTQEIQSNLFNVIRIDSKLRGTFIGTKMSALLKRCQLEPSKASIILEEGLLELETISPELKSIFIEILNNSLNDYLLKYGVKNYSFGGFADGYEIPSGKLSTDEFSIVRCECPTDLWNNTLTKEEVFKKPEPILKDVKNIECSLDDLIGVSKVLEDAAKQENLPERIEWICFGKYNIPVYFYKDTPKFPNNYLLGSENGVYKVSVLSRKFLISRCISTICIMIKNNDQSVINSIVEKYKMTDYYGLEDTVDRALRWYATEIFNAYNNEAQEQLIYEESLKLGVVMISFGNNYHIAVDNESVTVPRNVLVDMNNNGRYNSLYTSIVEESSKKIKQ